MYKRFNMVRLAFVVIVNFLFFNVAVGQNNTVSVYYLKNLGTSVTTKDSADLILKIEPPDSDVNRNLFIVRGYYPDGHLQMMGGSKTNSVDLKFEGPLITYFPNGHRKMLQNYQDGRAVGEVMQYYPNGRFYNRKKYTPDNTHGAKWEYIDCSDSTGKIMTVNGNGHWVTYNDNFTNQTEQGDVKNGLQDGLWTFWTNNNCTRATFKEGMVLTVVNCSRKRYDEHEPEFQGGLDNLYKFIHENVRYPARAIQNGTHGTVKVSFVIEKDGSLSDVKVVKGIGDGCDEEAMRVIRLSSPWKPGMQNGKPVRVVYSLPIGFWLSSH